MRDKGKIETLLRDNQQSGWWKKIKEGIIAEAIYEGEPPKWNYLLERKPLVILVVLGECSRKSSVLVCQLAFCGAVFGSVKFF